MLGRTTALVKLSLRGCGIETDDAWQQVFAGLSACSSLQELDLSDNEVPNPGSLRVASLARAALTCTTALVKFVYSQQVANI
jgi:Ran GTPase-activating protein (RanGAP) involved in mRNA processing and transport